MSDNLPLCGYRRKSYMLLGWGITSLSMFVLLAFSDLSFDAMDVMLEQQTYLGNYMVSYLKS